jgi:AcrR family transcriptional regulator
MELSLATYSPEPTLAVSSREDEILEHAVELLKGRLPALTMKKVADRVGFTETAAYRYFPRSRRWSPR